MATNAREQFIEDFFLVADNNFQTYQEIQEIGKRYYENDNLYELADALETWWDYRVEDMTREVKEYANMLFIRQMFLGWGSDTWHAIADRVWDSIAENEEVNA